MRRLTVGFRARAQAVTGSEDVSEEREGDETTEEDAKDADEGEAGTNSDVDEATGNYFGRAAAAPAAPEGANPFASSFSAAPEDDVAAMIRDAKAQVEEQRKSREIQEAKEREKERKAFEDSGREYRARRKAGDASESSPASSSGARRKVVKAKRPGQSPLGGASERAPATGGANPFAGFAALTGGAETTTKEAPRSSVFSRLSGAPTAADDDENASKGDDENKSPIVSAPASVEPAKPAAFGFFAPPPALTKENVDTQRTLKSIPKEDDDEDGDDAPKTTSGGAVKKVKTALAIELGL
jgi:hypothetical protein